MIGRFMAMLGLFVFSLLTHSAFGKVFEFNISLSDHHHHKVYDYQPQQVHLALNEHGDELVVTWSTMDDPGQGSSHVQYGEDRSELDQSQSGSYKIFIDGGKLRRHQFIHRVTLTGLKPDTLYWYHVGGYQGWSDLYQLRTFPSGQNWKPKIAVYGDLGSYNAQSLPLLQLQAQARAFDMIVHAGDLAYNLDTDDAKVGDEFMRQIEPMAAFVPYMVSPGNHEEAYNFSNYRARFSMPGGSENMFYSYNVGPIHFISFSTEFYYYLNYGIKMVANQYNWLLNDLKNANKPENRAKQPWVILVGHRPMYCSSKRPDCLIDSFPRVGIPPFHSFALEKMIHDYNVDLAFWGHEHNYERSWPIFNKHVFKGEDSQPYLNPKGTIHIVTGAAGNEEDHNEWQEPRPDFVAFRSRDYGFTHLTAHNATHLELTQISVNKAGKPLDHFYIISDHKFPSLPSEYYDEL